MTKEKAIIKLDRLKIDYFDTEVEKALDMAIGALEQESYEDAISRKEVFETFGELLGVWGRQALMEIPPVTPIQKWIPCSERLPESAFGCLVTVEEDDIYGEPHRVLYPDFVGYDGETWNDADGKPIPFEVIAWMPLPEPYKEVEE